MTDNPRIDELRRRVQEEPASIAFAQLAEELRRSSQFLEAVAVCRSGLENYPGYLSVRVTLGRCLIELDQLDEAEEELEQVRSSAPDNLAAIGALSRIHLRRGTAAEARAVGPAIQPAADVRLTPSEVRPKPDVLAAIPSLAPTPSATSIATPEQVRDARPVAARAPDPVVPHPVTPYIDKLIHVEVPATRRAPAVTDDEYMHVIRTLTSLEAWLSAIHVVRAGRSA